MEKVILTANAVISEAKRLQKEIRKTTKNYWCLEACAEAICDNPTNVVLQSVRSEAIGLAIAIDNGEE